MNHWSIQISSFCHTRLHSFWPFSTKGVSALHALSVRHECLRWKPKNSGVSLWPNPSFLPKVVSPEKVNQAIGLQVFCPDPACQGGLALHALFPVRVLKAYVVRTQPLGQAHTQLFMCYGDKQLRHPVSKQRLSHWLVETITQAYSRQGLPMPWV